MVGIQLGPWKWIAIHQVEGEQANICVAHQIQPQDLYTVIYDHISYLRAFRMEPTYPYVLSISLDHVKRGHQGARNTTDM